MMKILITKVFLQKGNLYDYLMEQIRLSNIEDDDLKIAEYIIGNLDNDGYLRRELKSLVDDLAFSQGIYTTLERVKYVLENYVQKLDPPGVAAKIYKNVCFFRLKKVSGDKAVILAGNILRHQFDALTNKHYAKIISKYDIEEEDLKDALK
jgi:RNA polymerase sigma-54 factor